MSKRGTYTHLGVPFFCKCTFFCKWVYALSIVPFVANGYTLSIVPFFAEFGDGRGGVGVGDGEGREGDCVLLGELGWVGPRDEVCFGCCVSSLKNSVL